jgi:hypothetical protein
MKIRLRRKSMDPKYGVARGVAVFTSKDSESSDVVIGALPDSGRLRQWSLEHGVVLTDDLASLEELDAHIDEWNADPLHFESVDLGNEVGMYVGSVIVQNIAGARWRIWPNGHPVISLESGKECDVIALTNERIMRSTSSLASIYARASTQ